MQLNQCLISRQRRILNSEMGREFAAAGSYKQSYPQKLGRVGPAINILGSVNSGIVDKLVIYMDLFEMNAHAALKNFVTEYMTPNGPLPHQYSTGTGARSDSIRTPLVNLVIGG